MIELKNFNKYKYSEKMQSSIKINSEQENFR